jgi:hypothetical protein
MFKKIIVAGLLVSASAPAWAESGQLGPNQIWGNPNTSQGPPKPSNLGSFLTQGPGITISGTPKATIGITNSITAAGPMGSATQTIVLTFNAQGEITAATLATIAPPFTAITGSLACSQEPARTGDTTSPAGSCVNTTVKVNGVAFGTSPSTDTVPVITASNTATYTALPNCPAGTGFLNYVTSTHLFSCNAAAGTGTVTNVATAGLATGGPISGSGTITVSAAVKSDQVTATSTSVAVVPAIQQNHPSAAKAWVTFVGTTGVILDAYQVASVVRSSAGSYAVTLTTPFVDANYPALVTTQGTASGGTNGRTSSQTTTVINVVATNSSGTATDPTVSVTVVAFGTQ